MAASIDRIIYSSAGVKAVEILAQAIPPRVGHAVGDMIAGWLASCRDSQLIKAVRANQQTVNDGCLAPVALDDAVHSVLHYSARAQYDLYHYVQNRAAIEEIYHFDAACDIFLHRQQFEKRGLILAALHTPGWDLGLRWLCRDKLSFRPVVLTIPHPEGGRQLEFEGREHMGMEMIPGSVHGLRRAIRYLRQGGFVLTGVDRPVPGTEPKPRFFGQRASLPVHHIYIALKAHVPIVVETCCLGEDGSYSVHASPPIEMDECHDREQELLVNAEKVLAAAEDFIRKAPRQWLMYQPVWPEPGGPAEG